MKSRWTRLREAIADMSDMIAIGRAVENNRMTVDQARLAIAAIDARRLPPRSASVDVQVLESPVAGGGERQDLETAGVR